MTDQQDQHQGGVATVERTPPNDAPPDDLTQSPLDPDTPLAASAGRGADRKAARELKRAERGERRSDRKDRKLGAAVVAGSTAAAEPAPSLAGEDGDSSNDGEEPLTDAIPAAASAPTGTPETPVEDEPLVEQVAPSAGEGAAANGDEAAAETPGVNGRRADRLERKAARRDAKADGSAPTSREERRADREERKAQRPAKPARAALAGASANGVADSEATPVGDGAAPEGARPPVLVRAEIGAIPGGADKAKRADRMAGRVDVQRAAAEEVLAAIDPNNAAIAPLIRYVNAVSMHLNESQKMIGKLQVERDALRAQVVSLDAEPIDASRFAEIAQATAGSEQADAKEQRRNERRAAKTAEGDAAESDDDAAAAPMDDVGRKRRLMALGLLAVVGLVAMATRLMNHPIDLSNMSKGSLGGVAVIGQFMQVFLAGMIFYRLARIGGRGARWLFPENDPKMAKKQQQEAKARKQKARQADA